MSLSISITTPKYFESHVVVGQRSCHKNINPEFHRVYILCGHTLAYLLHKYLKLYFFLICVNAQGYVCIRCKCRIHLYFNINQNRNNSLLWIRLWTAKCLHTMPARRLVSPEHSYIACNLSYLLPILILHLSVFFGLLSIDRT